MEDVLVAAAAREQGHDDRDEREGRPRRQLPIHGPTDGYPAARLKNGRGVETDVGWSFEPLPAAALAAVAIAYARRALASGAAADRRRGGSRRVGRALATLALALFSPLDRIGETRLFSVHMAQHLLIGDVAPLLAILGLSGPLLRPVLALPGAIRLRRLAHPLVALPLWAASLVAWHVPAAYDAALRHPAVHDLQHLSFFTCGLLFWAAVLEVLPGPRWYGLGSKLVSLAFAWLVGGMLANVFLWSHEAFYAPYRHAPRLWGLTPLADQRLGGGVMLLETSAVMLAVALVVGARWLGEG